MAHKEYRACLQPYEQYWSSGPYLSKQDNRLKISLLGGGLDKTSTTMTYARYLYAVHTRKDIPPDVEIDHEDGNKLNDSVGNLVALTKAEHHEKTLNDPTRLSMKKTVTLVCPNCGITFSLEYSKSFLARGGHASYCSKECSRFSKRHMNKPQVIVRKERVQDTLPRIFEPWEIWSREITEEVKSTLPIKRGSVLNSLSRSKRKCPTCLEFFQPSCTEQKFCGTVCSNRRRDRKAKVDPTALDGVLRRVHRKELSYAAAGRILGVSDNAIRKRYLKAYPNRADRGT